MNSDQAKQIQTEAIRWLILRAVDAGDPLGATEGMILPTVRTAWSTTSPELVRRELDYLEARGLVTLERPPVRPWRAKLTRHGRDVVHYTVDVDPGIDRPPKTPAEEV